MRCNCCDVPLTDYECTIKDVFGHPIDLCLDCLDAVDGTIPGITYEDRVDLRSEGFVVGIDFLESNKDDENWD